MQIKQFEFQLSSSLTMNYDIFRVDDLVPSSSAWTQVSQLHLPTPTGYSDWRLRDSFPSKVISINEETALVEIVVDSERKNTREYIVSISLFSGLGLQVGSFFKLLYFERPNAITIQAINSQYITEKDFPQFDFEKFSTISVFD